MGLLDNLLFNQDGYGGQQGGLLGFLQGAAAQNAAYQPSAGFPQQGATFADRFNAIPQQQQPQRPPDAPPIAIGNYMMPRVGPASDFQPQPQQQQPAQAPMTDVSAQARQDQAAPQMPLPPALGGGNYIDRLRSGGSLIGSLFGGNAQQQNLNAQFQATRQALIQNGVPPAQAHSTALLSVLNPEAAKTVLPELLTNKQDIKMVKDEFGAEHPYWYDKINQTFKPALTQGGSEGSPSGGMQQTIGNLNNMPSGATQEQRLAQVPEAYRGYVKSLLAGQALPQNIGRSQLRGPLMTLAHAVDPNFDETNIPLRFKTATDYAPNGQSGKSIVALNTVQHHIGQLSDALQNPNLGDTGWTFFNRIRNGIAQNTPLDKTQGAAIKQVQDAMTAVEDEMANAYKAGRVSDSEIQRWHALTNTDMPLPQLKQGLADFVGLLNGKRDQLNETHQQILGREAPGINRDLNEAITKKVTDRNSGDNSTSQGSSAKPQTVIQNGHVYTLQADGSYK